MIQRTFLKKFFTALIILAVMAFTGCEKKPEQKQDEMKSNSVTADTSSSVSSAKESEPVVEEKVAIPDLKGT
jgi:hypothetical protein